MNWRPLLVIPLALAGCDSGVTVAASGCSEKELNAKIEKYSRTAARLGERDMTAWDEAAAGRWAEMSARLGEKSADLQKRALPLAAEGGGALTQELCKGYDELQAILDTAARL
jgi:hypothetical protein